MKNRPIRYDGIDVTVAPFQFSVRDAKGQTVKLISFTSTYTSYYEACLIYHKIKKIIEH